MANEINRTRPIPVVPSQVLVAREVRTDKVDQIGAIGSGDGDSSREAWKWLIALQSRASTRPVELPTTQEAIHQPAAKLDEPATYQRTVPFNAVKNPSGSVQAGLEAVLKSRPATAKSERPSGDKPFRVPILFVG